jgi:hypothetical protein
MAISNSKPFFKRILTALFTAFTPTISASINWPLLFVQTRISAAATPCRSKMPKATMPRVIFMAI